MRFKIYPNYFAPKCADRNKNFDTRNSHAIYFIPCNFKCRFCKNGVVTETTHNNISISEFESIVQFLMKSGTMFKFTGGEPTLIPELEAMLRIVKRYNGYVFLDSNGSRNEIINKLIHEDLIDVLGLSIKGLTPESAAQTAGVKSELCWKNVLDSIKITQSSKIRLIVTFVLYNSVDIIGLYDFLDLLQSLNDSCFFKLNNLYGNIHRDLSLNPMTPTQTDLIINNILTNRPEWKNRLILVENFDSVSNYESIKFF